MGKEPSAKGREPSARGREPSAMGKEPSAKGREPSARGREPSARGREPSAMGRSPSGSSPRRPAEGVLTKRPLLEASLTTVSTTRGRRPGPALRARFPPAAPALPAVSTRAKRCVAPFAHACRIGSVAPRAPAATRATVQAAAVKAPAAHPLPRPARVAAPCDRQTSQRSRFCLGAPTADSSASASLSVRNDN
jgi:hypothetical protein